MPSVLKLDDPVLLFVAFIIVVGLWNVYRIASVGVRRFAPVGVAAAAVVIVVALAVQLLIPALLIPSSRLVEWQLTGFNGPDFDPTTAQTTDVIPVFVAAWPADYPATGDSWLATPAITYTPWSVTITLHTSDFYEAFIAKNGVAFFDTGGWFKVQLSEPLGGRALSDGSKFPPDARPYP